MHPVHVREDRPDWNAFARGWLRENGIKRGLALLTQGPSEQHPCGNHRMEILELEPGTLYRCNQETEGD